MTAAVATFSTLLTLATGKPLREDGDARRMQLAIAAGIGSLIFAAVWGLCAGVRDASVAVPNAYKVPMVVLLSTLIALPGGLLAARLSETNYRVSDLMVSFMSAVFSGTLVLAVLSPLVAIYYMTSEWGGPLLGMGSAIIAIVVGTLVFIRGSLARAGDDVNRGMLAIPIVVVIAMQLASLVQLIALASPILPETTVFDGGIDRMITG